MNRFGITGGIGSGKTYLSRLLEQRGFAIFNCDETARRLMLQDTTLQRDLSDLIGKPAVTPQGELDKQAIGAYLFASPDHIKQVNALVHPRVRTAFREWAERMEERQPADTASPMARQWIGMECSILFESRFDSLVEFIISVYAPKVVRLKRVTERDGLTPRQVEERMARQWPEREKLRRSDFIFRNDGQHAAETQLQTLEAALHARSGKRD